MLVQDAARPVVEQLGQVFPVVGALYDVAKEHWRVEMQEAHVLVVGLWRDLKVRCVVQVRCPGVVGALRKHFDRSAFFVRWVWHVMVATGREYVQVLQYRVLFEQLEHAIDFFLGGIAALSWPEIVASCHDEVEVFGTVLRGIELHVRDGI